MSETATVEQHEHHIPVTFNRKKLAIRNQLNRSVSDYADYADKSPKGSVDAEILDLIAEINDFEGYVTTSSCAGRHSVFVEGRKARPKHTNGVENDVADVTDITQYDESASRTSSGPGGKGNGNKWLYTAHSQLAENYLNSESSLYKLYQLQPQTSSHANQGVSPRLIKLSFAPLILHISCANLHAAKRLLAAVINAGFRESGVQSLKALDDEEAGVMLAVRSTGLSFETVVGIVEENGSEERYTAIVGDEYLKTCTAVINERFAWNDERKERLMNELLKLKEEDEKHSEWEDTAARRQRKRAEGLKKQQEKK